jgi:hypothetical protein
MTRQLSALNGHRHPPTGWNLVRRRSQVSEVELQWAAKGWRDLPPRTGEALFDRLILERRKVWGRCQVWNQTWEGLRHIDAAGLKIEIGADPRCLSRSRLLRQYFVLTSGSRAANKESAPRQEIEDGQRKVQYRLEIRKTGPTFCFMNCANDRMIKSAVLLIASFLAAVPSLAYARASQQTSGTSGAPLQALNHPKLISQSARDSQGKKRSEAAWKVRIKTITTQRVQAEVNARREAALKAAIAQEKIAARAPASVGHVSTKGSPTRTMKRLALANHSARTSAGTRAFTPSRATPRLR